MPQDASGFSTLQRCFHCGTEFSSPPPLDGARFCCAGCEAVYQLLQTQGLAAFYQLKQPDVCLSPVATSAKSYSEFDDPLWIKDMSDDLLSLEIYLEGLSCTACVWLLEQLPKTCKDCVAARVNLHRSTVTVHRSPSGSFSAIAQAISRYGYQPQPLRRPEAHAELERKSQRQDLLRLAVAGASAGNIMLLSVSIYAGASHEWARYFSQISGLLALPALIWSAWPLYKNAFRGLVLKQLNIDAPIVMAIVAGTFVSLRSILANTNDVYFDSLTMLIFLLLSSRYFLKRVQHRFLLPTHLEEALLVGQVLKQSGSTFVACSLRSVHANDVIRMKAGQLIPFDGTLVCTEGLIEKSYLTGESLPIAVFQNEQIESGARALSALDIRAHADVHHSKLFKSLQAATLSARGRPPVVELSDRVGRWFLTVVFTLALIVLAHFSSASMTDEGLRRALALVIVTCPCVFGFGIPLTYSLALQKAMAHGILINGIDIWSRLNGIRTIYFDKTGTLTTGALQITDFVASEGMTDFDWQIFISLESTQAHPVAVAVTQFFANKVSGSLLDLTDVRRLAKGGVTVVVDGVFYSVAPNPNAGPEIIGALYGYYQFKKNDQILLRFSVCDQIRKSLRPALQQFVHQGFRLGILSGDQAQPVLSAARILNFDLAQVHFQMTATTKAQVIASQKFPVMMVGDGANDAEALGAASVGIAVQGGLDCSLGVADAYVSPADLGPSLQHLFSLATTIRRTHIRNLIFATTFNVVSATLAIGGWMSPLLAAVLMPASSLLVLSSTLWGFR